MESGKFSFVSRSFWRDSLNRFDLITCSTWPHALQRDLGLLTGIISKRLTRRLQLGEAVPFLPRPFVFATGMNRNSPGRQIKPPVRRHGERRGKLALPTKSAR